MKYRDYALHRRDAVLDVVAKAPAPLERKEIARGVHMSPGSICDILRDLTRAGKLVSRRIGPHVVRYATPEREAELAAMVAQVRAEYAERYEHGMTRSDASWADSPPVRRVIPAGQWQASVPPVRSVFDLGAQA